ncbi:type VI secretion system lipoprotein TssJ [Pseudomonas sp. NPDC089396]|uniref:type VI secretion system lipoprotein TssJ n=1 Tax=Pseudomonas sp. NPDC089396 TaxID=3364461 RepID=UPI0038324C5F
MWRTVFNVLTVMATAGGLSGCGLTQTVADTSSAVTKAIFYKQVKTLHLDVVGRAAINTDVADGRGLSVPTLVRVYQLRDGKALERLTYDDWLSNADRMLRDDLLSERTLVIKPDGAASLSMPMEEDTRVVAVVALLRAPDSQSNTWRLKLSRDDLDPDQARVVELGDNRLALRPRSKE